MAESINVKPKFTFRYLEGHEFNFLTNRNIKELLQKWLVNIPPMLYTCQHVDILVLSRLYLTVAKINRVHIGKTY